MDNIRFTTWGAVALSILVAFGFVKLASHKIKGTWLRRFAIAAAAVAGLVAYKLIPVSWRLAVPVANTPVVPGALP
jgi:hypothetical protein